ncbi:chorismate mutase [Blastocladiella britannica]|nr:chorismate mutase [Blastocladiella britannica]
MDFNDTTTPALSLDKLRNVLVRLEDTIIFGLIERYESLDPVEAQFKQNERIYVQGAFPFDSVPSFHGSFLDWFLHETEKVHAQVRRYTSPDEYPFTSPLPAPILPPLDFRRDLHPNSININPHIMSMYILHIVPQLCAAGDDGNHGSAATRDVESLQALSKRIHYGKYIAEAKFQADREGYTALIRAGDTAGLMARLTNQQVEDRLLLRLRRKAELYGHELDEDGEILSDSAPDSPPTTIQQLQQQQQSPPKMRQRRSRLDLDVVVRLYRDFVIPLTKRVEVDYLLTRLSEMDQ